ncbi:phosphoribosylaminoimidazole-succinocarboxamide synthase-like [Schistocerca gregaria]|uniref:phosphoribosylaminoimidazole-succinocarboxamide synthase-like n=1 Tax=Schistocerca gregaria TaxID=7010 RepID=UPI00211EB581|nr:phosphoribosylaminoimidazole-succinocarboxamide synthase-like [Schistocerca gregaria]
MCDSSNCESPYLSIICQNLKHALKNTDLTSIPGILPYHSGKVRDIFSLADLPNNLLMVTSDRLSAFDRVLTDIPFKGQVLAQLSQYWFQELSHIIPTHFILSLDPNVWLTHRCTVFQIEFVVRGYITGTTETSLWTRYAAGERTYSGIKLEEGLKKNQKLPCPVVTPTTKSTDHDRPISPEEIVQEGWMKKEEYEYCAKKALQLYEKGVKTALEKGLLLVDTKYEFAKDQNGVILLVDEVHTPDSSRYWLASSYMDRFSNNLDPECFDKDIIRRWYQKNSDPYRDENLPEAPKELIADVSLRYIKLYETLTGLKFEFQDELDTSRRVRTKIEKWINGSKSQTS